MVFVFRAPASFAWDRGHLGAVTMQAVSTRLGLTTMAVYRYVPSKGALVDLAADRAMGRPPKPESSQRGNRPCLARRPDTLR